MKLLERYVFREIMAPFLFGVAAFSMIFVATDPLRQALRLLVRHDAGTWQVLAIFLLRLPDIVVLTLPMAVLLGVLMALGRLSTQGEITAMQAGGMSFYRVCTAPLLLGAIVSVCSFYGNESLVPRCREISDRMLFRLGERSAEEGGQTLLLASPSHGPLERIIKADSFDRERGLLRHPDVIEYRDGRPVLVVSARQAVWNGETWEFTDGFIQTIRATGGSFSAPFTHVKRTIGKTPAEVESEQMGTDPSDLSLHRLRQYIEALQSANVKGTELYTAMVEEQNRYAMPLASLLFALIASPLAVRPQRTSPSLAFGLSIVVIFFYFVLWDNATMLGNGGRIPAAVAAWTANVVFALFGSFLIWRRS